MNELHTTVACFTLVVTLTDATQAQQAGIDLRWNQFRGPRGDGTALHAKLPAEFGEARNVRWKAAIHDEGWSSPVV